MANVIVAIACNLVLTLILFSGILTSLKSGWKVALSKFILMLACCVGTYFLTPVITDFIYNFTYKETYLGVILSELFSISVMNSLIFTIVFILFYCIDLIICNMIKHALIKKLREKSENTAKMKRARSINPKAERMVRKAQWKALKAEYKAANVWWKKLISVTLGIVTAVIVGIITLIPFKYVAKKLNVGGDRPHLETGYSYTLNGVIDNKFEGFFDWTIGGTEFIIPTPETAPEVPE